MSRRFVVPSPWCSNQCNRFLRDGPSRNFERGGSQRKKIGVTRFGACTDFAVRKSLEKYQLKPITDVPIMQIGGMPEIAAALSKGPSR
jgi:ABC-type nitrate/sulfonate/bicarbonate transport system substrate-binding protein